MLRLPFVGKADFGSCKNLTTNLFYFILTILFASQYVHFALGNAQRMALFPSVVKYKKTRKNRSSTGCNNTSHTVSMDTNYFTKGPRLGNVIV